MSFILNLSPLTQKKVQRFKGIKRGYWSFLILSLLLVLSIFAEVFVNSRALLVSYQGQWHFPTYGDVKSGDTFGLGYVHEANYRELQLKFEQESEGNFVIMPIVPWNPYEQDFSGDFPPTEPKIGRASCRERV